MTGKLITLIDASIYAQSVCDTAAWVASRTGFAVELMHVVDPPERNGDGDLSGAIALGARTALLEKLSELDEERAKLVNQRGRALLEDARTVLEGHGITVSEHLRRGDLLEAIKERSGDADMLLIGKRGEAADFAKAHLGSNLDRIMRETAKPLFIAARAFRPVERVLIAFDGSSSAQRAVDYVARSPLHQGLDVSVVSVGVETAAAQKGLQDARAMLGAAGLTADTKLLPGQPADVLGKLVETAPFDHLVMGASGHTRLRKMFVGSNSLQLVRECKVPILLIR
ncbi:MAG: universal stress protein [Pseudomonadota bacterium]